MGSRHMSFREVIHFVCIVQECPGCMGRDFSKDHLVDLELWEEREGGFSMDPIDAMD